MKKLVIASVVILTMAAFAVQKYHTLTVVSLLAACSHQRVTYKGAIYNPFSSSVTLKSPTLSSVGGDVMVTAKRLTLTGIKSVEGFPIPVIAIAENVSILPFEKVVNTINITDFKVTGGEQGATNIDMLLQNLDLPLTDGEIRWQCKVIR
jgi:hypothetical protein